MNAKKKLRKTCPVHRVSKINSKQKTSTVQDIVHLKYAKSTIDIFSFTTLKYLRLSCQINKKHGIEFKVFGANQYFSHNGSYTITFII